MLLVTECLDSIFIFSYRENKGSHQFLNWWQRHATGMPHLNGFESVQKEIKGSSKRNFPLFGPSDWIRTSGNAVLTHGIPIAAF